MQPISVSDLNQLQGKESGMENDSTTKSRKRTCDGRSVLRRSTKLNTENSRIFSNMRTFRVVALKPVKHEPFLEKPDSRTSSRLTGLENKVGSKKIHQFALRWQCKVRKGPRNIESSPDVDYEFEMPVKPRFCATLSTEAQYATFKGYEDVLVDKISSSLPPIQKTLPIKRIPSATAKPLTNSNKSSFPTLENKPNIVLIASENTMETEKIAKDTRSARRQKNWDQRYMSTHFRHAMNILDELKRNNYTSSNTDETATEVEDQDNVVTLKNNIRQYHAWSQRWAKHFEFSRDNALKK